MSTRSELRTLGRLAPEIDSTTLSDANFNTLLDKAQIDLSVKGRALMKNEKLNAVKDQREYVISGASSLLTDNDFLAVDLDGGGVLFNDGSRWIGPPELKSVTREWLDINQPDWRTVTSASSPLYWYQDAKEDASSDLVIGFEPRPDAARTDAIWLHYLSRGKLMTADTHYPWTGSTTQLAHLEPYEMLLVYWCWEFIARNISKQDVVADAYLKIYLVGAALMAARQPIEAAIVRSGFKTNTPLTRMTRRGVQARF